MNGPMAFLLLALACVVTGHQSIEELAAKVERLQAQIDAQQVQVAFSASRQVVGAGFYGPLTVESTLIFKNVKTNIGDAYSPISGLFTAPVKGTYSFQWHVGSFSDANLNPTSAWLFKNQEKTYMAFEWEKDGFGSASQSIILELDAGDLVYLRMEINSRVFDNANDHNSFSGHLLFTM